MPLTSIHMGALDKFGEALRLLRSQRGITSQSELAAKSKLAVTTVNKIETGKRLPDLGTTEALLKALSADLYDLARALDTVNQRVPATRPGRAHPDWVAALSRRGIDQEALWGFALGVLDRGKPDAEADFIASVEAAAHEIARAAIAEAGLGIEPELMEVAEPSDDSPQPEKPAKRRRRAR